MPNFMLKNPNSDATIEQTAYSQEDNQCGDNERPDVGDSWGDRPVIRRSPAPLSASATLTLGQYVQILTVSYSALSFPDFYAKNIDMRTKLEGIAIGVVCVQFSTVAVTANLILRIIPIRTIGNHRNDFMLLPRGLYGKWRGFIHYFFCAVSLVFYR